MSVRVRECVRRGSVVQWGHSQFPQLLLPFVQLDSTRPAFARLRVAAQAGVDGCIFGRHAGFIHSFIHSMVL